MNKNIEHLGSKLLIMLAGILWGCMGLFVRPLNEKGLNSWDIVFLTRREQEIPHLYRLWDELR